MNLSKLFEMQRQLDEHIMDEHPELKGQNNLDWKILALQVELGECANEWRGFKKWSKDQEPRTVLEVFCKECQGTGTPIGIPEESGVDCWKCEGTGSYFKNPLLEEYVDCLHFILSIGNEISYGDTWFVKAVYPKNGKITTKFTVERFNDCFNFAGMLLEDDYYNALFQHFLDLGYLLGFTWDQIEKAYFDKNEINHKRQEASY